MREDKARLLLDMSSVMWMCLLAGEDRECGYKAPWPDAPDLKPAQINGCDYGYENAINHIVKTLNRFDLSPKDIIMVFDGEGAKLLRQQAHKGYKEGRSHHPDQYLQFNALKAKLQQALLDLGAIAVEQKGLEADDVLAFLSEVLPHTIVDTNDGDMLVLSKPGRCVVYRDGELDVNKYGPFPNKHVLTWKCLVGDTTDKIPGAIGFGEKSFIEMLCQYKLPGLDLMLELIEQQRLGELTEDVLDFKPFRKIVDHAQSVYMSYQCARLYPELVNSGRRKLVVTAGKVVPWVKGCDERLDRWYGRCYLGRPENIEKLTEWAAQHFQHSDYVSLDIETSPPDESVEWLEAKKRSKGGEDGDDLGVDAFGAELTGGSMTFGDNQQYTIYLPVDHTEADGVCNVPSSRFRRIVEQVPPELNIVVHNASFELAVLLQEWGVEWKDNGFEGMLPNIHDTTILASYENENEKRGLKGCSAHILRYEQQTFQDVTKGRRMNEMTATETFGYGCDDTICTSALYNYYALMCQIEGTWEVYKQVEVDCAYLNAKRYVQGTPISLQRMFDLERQDEADSAAAAKLFRDFLISRGWAGTAKPVITPTTRLDAPRIKTLLPEIVGDLPDEKQFKSQMRKPEKLVVAIDAWAAEHDIELGRRYAGCLALALDGDPDALNRLIDATFKGDPVINLDSPKQMAGLLYDTLGLPIRLRNKPTDTMKANGIREGNARTDDLALEFALAYDQDKGPEVIGVVKAIQTLKTTATKRKMFYRPYRFMQHWKDGLVHADVIQCAAVTRRYASAGPNLQQLPKHPKHGIPPKFREIYIPHA